MVDGLNSDKETWYMEQGWDYNVKNCDIPVERSVMISENAYDAEWCALEAGIIIGSLNISGYDMHYCGKWHWIEFEKEEDAVAFKLKWV